MSLTGARRPVPGPHRMISRREETQKSYIRNWHRYSRQSNGGRSTSGGDTRLAGSIHASSRSRNVWCHGTDWVCLFLVTRTKIPRLVAPSYLIQGQFTSAQGHRDLMITCIDTVRAVAVSCIRYRDVQSSETRTSYRFSTRVVQR